MEEQAALLELAHDAIFVRDLDGRVTYWNRGAEQTYGWTKAQALGQTSHQMLHTEFPKPLREIEEEVFRAGRWEGELLHTRRDGARLVVESRWALQRDAHGRPKAILEINRDVTRRKRAEEALRRAHDELERRVRERTADLAAANEALRDADRRKDEFLAMLSHELRNPLAPLLHGLHVLKTPGADAGAVEKARAAMERQIGHLARIVEDLLDVSRIQGGQVVLRRERLDLGRLARATAEDHRPAFERAGVALGHELPELPVWVLGDPTRLAQVLGNLLDNAARFTDRGGRVTLRLAVEADPARAVLTVRDTGVGIEAGLLPHLFEVFTQADRSLDRTRGGLGLGLALVKGLTELHGGEVRASSPGPGRGAEFVVRLPAQPEPAALSDMPAAPGRAPERLRILVVEDNQDSADMLQMLLALYGHEVRVAYTGPAGVQAAREWRPEIVLCDIGLPGLDGYGVAGELRSNPATAKARLIAVTGYGQEEDRRRARQAGFDHHLTKPVDPDALLELLARAA